MREQSKRLIDGDKFLEWIEKIRQQDMRLRDEVTRQDEQRKYEQYVYASDVLIGEIKSGIFDIPSDQGEAARLRETLEDIRRGEFGQVGHSTWITEQIDHVLSSNTEEPDAIDHFVDDMERIGWKNTEDAKPSISSMGLMLKPDGGDNTETVEIRSEENNS